MSAPKPVELDPPAQNPKLQEISPEKTAEIVQIYRGWDAFERGHRGPQIVDFDMAIMPGSTSFSCRREVLCALSEIYEKLADVSDAEEFLRARVRGSIAYLRVLMGQQIEFPDYLMSTLGVEPRPFSAAETESAARSVSKALEPFGLQLRTEDRERFESQLVVNDPNTIRKGIVGARDFWLRQLNEAGIPVPKQLSLSVEFTEVDAYWSNWISGERRGIKLEINLHARKKYDRGRTLALCLHEVCGHAVQMSLWRDMISRLQLNEACGVTTVHTPEAFVMEGLAQTVPDLLSDISDYPDEFKLSRALNYHSLAVLHNAHIMIYEGLPVDQILDYASDNLPLSDPDTLEYEIRDRALNPLFRSYELSYAIAERTIRDQIDGMTIPQKRRFFLEMYTKPMTPKQLLDAGVRIRG
jgi:hypothetical protein